MVQSLNHDSMIVLPVFVNSCRRARRVVTKYKANLWSLFIGWHGWLVILVVLALRLSVTCTGLVSDGYVEPALELGIYTPLQCACALINIYCSWVKSQKIKKVPGYEKGSHPWKLGLFCCVWCITLGDR